MYYIFIYHSCVTLQLLCTLLIVILIILVFFTVHRLVCRFHCSVTWREKSLRRCSRWHVRNSIVFPSGSRTTRRWELVCGGAMREVAPVSVELSSDASYSSCNDARHYHFALRPLGICWRFGDRCIFLSYDTSLCYAKSYYANTVGCLLLTALVLC